MTTLTVVPGGSIQAAIDAASSGDTIDVAAGDYGSQFLNITKSLTIEAIGGPAILHATSPAPNGKAIITEGAAGITVNISGFDVSGAVVGDNNGAAIRYEGGALNLSNVDLHNNQEGLLGAADPNGTITIDHSEIDHNGDGSGSTHNLYIGDIAKFTLTNSYVHDAIVGHEVKSCAATNVITGNRIFDNSGSASYSIDLPNGGAANVTANVIEQGPNTQNPAIFAWGEEGITHPGMMFITGNTIVNDDLASNAYGVLGGPASFTGNSDWNLANLGNVVASANTDLVARPTLDTSAEQFTYPGGTVTPPPPPPPVLHGHGHNGHHHALTVEMPVSDRQ